MPVLVLHLVFIEKIAHLIIHGCLIVGDDGKRDIDRLGLRLLLR